LLPAPQAASNPRLEKRRASFKRGQSMSARFRTGLIISTSSRKVCDFPHGRFASPKSSQGACCCRKLAAGIQESRHRGHNAGKVCSKERPPWPACAPDPSRISIKLRWPKASSRRWRVSRWRDRAEFPDDCRQPITIAGGRVGSAVNLSYSGHVSIAGDLPHVVEATRIAVIAARKRAQIQGCARVARPKGGVNGCVVGEV
jgi:hypothetical protein